MGFHIHAIAFYIHSHVYCFLYTWYCFLYTWYCFLCTRVFKYAFLYTPHVQAIYKILFDISVLLFMGFYIRAINKYCAILNSQTVLVMDEYCVYEKQWHVYRMQYNCYLREITAGNNSLIFCYGFLYTWDEHFALSWLLFKYN